MGESFWGLNVAFLASTIFSHLQSLWPFSIFKHDDLRASTKLVGKLLIPEQTKGFVFAAHEPDSHAVIYILAAQNLSEQSAIDAQHLIHAVQPRAVIAQVAPSALADIQREEKCLRPDQANGVPTSPFGVLKRCFTEKINKAQYEKIAGCQVLQEIFGIGFHGHLLAAKNAAEHTGSCFFLLESPYGNPSSAKPPDDAKCGDQSRTLLLPTRGLVPGSITSPVNSNIRKICIIDTLQLQMVKSLAPSLAVLMSKSGAPDSALDQELYEIQMLNGYEPPPFAQSVYPLLVDLYEIFTDIPSIGKALVSAQKILARIHDGEPVNKQILSDVYIFRIAIEGLRVALNNVARCHVDRTQNGGLEFDELPGKEKSDALFAQALRSQARKFGSVVAVVDASCLAGIRRHWNTPVPSEAKDLADECFVHYDNAEDVNVDDEHLADTNDKRRLLADNPMVAVGAGATAILGASSLSKAVHASTFFKLATYKAPVALKCGISQLQRRAAIGLGKILAGPNAFKFMASAQKIRAVTHSMILSAERTSLLAMRTAFYEIMRRERARPVRIAPWVTFGCSMAACAGLLVHGDGIECAAESLPSVPAIASLGRGLESLRSASQEARRTSGAKIQAALESLVHGLKGKKVERGFHQYISD